MESKVNPWVRSEQEIFSVETLELIPAGAREEYTRIMKQLAHAKGIAALALEQVYQVEEQRHAFFEWVQDV